MKHALLLSLGLAFVATAAPATPHDAIGAAVESKMPKSWFTPEQKAFIQAKCGIDVDHHDRGRNFDIHGSTMTCPDGRTVNDPYVKVMSEDISKRANDYVAQVMKDVDVQTAIARRAGDEARKAIAEANIDARVAEAMAQADIARRTSAEVRKAIDEAHIEQQVQQALAQAEIGRKTAERVRDALAKSGMNDTR
jgi:hypothetical protein